MLGVPCLSLARTKSVSRHHQLFFGGPNCAHLRIAAFFLCLHSYKSFWKMMSARPILSPLVWDLQTLLCFSNLVKPQMYGYPILLPLAHWPVLAWCHLTLVITCQKVAWSCKCVVISWLFFSCFPWSCRHDRHMINLPNYHRRHCHQKFCCSIARVTFCVQSSCHHSVLMLLG